MPETFLKIDNLSYSYNRSSCVLKKISLELRKGECLGVIGLNGSGKTTLCYCICGLIPHYYQGMMEGRVLIDGRDTRGIPLKQIAEEIGIVLQDPNDQIIMPTVEDEIAFSLENNRIPRQEIALRIQQVLEQVGLQELKEEDPNRLSGGEKQLVVIAAALALRPPALVFDESLSMLDDISCQKVLAVLAKLKRMGKTMVIVDHTWKSVHLFDRVIVLEEGRIIFQGSPQDLVRDKGFREQHKLD